MEHGLNLDSLPEYSFSSFKYFAPGEIHVTRVCNEDVLILMLEGELNFEENGKQIKLCKNQYYIQRRGLKQSGNIPSSSAVYYYIHFNGKFDDSNNTLPITGYFDSDYCISLCKELNFIQSIGGTLTEKAALFFQILSRLKMNLTLSNKKRVVKNITEEIANHIEVPYSLDMLAEKFNYSKNHIINVFKKETGKTPYEYITEMRIEKAKALLSYSTLSVNDIAEQTGFGNYVNFYKSFTKAENCSPARWRKTVLSFYFDAD